MRFFTHMSLFAVFFAAPAAFAYLPVASVPSPDGYEWQEVNDLETHTLTLHLRSTSGGPTNIFFTFGFPRGKLLESQSLDLKRSLHVPFPGRTLWQPHPDSNMTLEDKFMHVTAAAGYPANQRLPLFLQNGSWVYMATIFDHFAQVQDARHSSFMELHALTKARVTLTQKKILERVVTYIHAAKLLSPRLENFLLGEQTYPADFSWQKTAILKALAFFDVVEPIEGLEADGHKGLYGFTLLPLETLAQHGALALNQAMFGLRQSGECPLTWVKEQQDVPLRVRLAVLSLITHNHLSEEIFLSGVVAKHGLNYGWAFAQQINDLYRIDRECLDRQHLVAQEKLSAIYPAARENSLYGHHNQKAVAVVTAEGTRYLPYYKFYHFYGAVILGARLRAVIPASSVWPTSIQRELVSELTQIAGRSYKQMSAGLGSNEIDIMTEIYGLGGKVGFDLK